MAENIEEVIQEETIQNNITPVAQTETIETDIDITDGNQQVDVVTDVTNGEPEKTNEEKLAEVHKKQDEMRREALKNGNLANVNNDPTYKALIEQSKNLTKAIKTQDKTLGDVLSSFGEEDQQQSDQSNLLQTDYKAELGSNLFTGTPLNNEEKEALNNYIEDPKKGVLGFGESSNEISKQNTFGTQDESIFRS